MSDPAAATARGLLASSLVAVAAISVVALVAHVLTAPLDHDEHMYVAAGVLWPERHLYSDFLYFQTPYLPVLYSALFGAAHVERLLFAARLITAVITFAAALLVGGVAWRLGRDVGAAAAAVLLFCASPAVQNAVGQASNYAAPMAASMCACALLLLPAKRRPLALAGCGAALGVAIGLKLYYATLVLPIAASVWIAPQRSAHRLLLPFFAGLGVAVAPAAFLVLRDPVAGWFANVGYHTLNTQWWAASGWDVSITLRERVAFARWLLSAPAHRLCAAAIVLAAVAGLLTRARLRKAATSESVWAAATCGALMTTAVLTALVPSPSWPQYYAMAVPFAALLPASLLGCAGRDRPAWLGLGVAFVALLAMLPTAPALGALLPRLVAPQEWTGNQVHARAETLRRLVPDAPTAARVLTLAPLFPLEGGLAIYPELASADFAYRASHLVRPELRSRLALLGPDDVIGRVQQDETRAILVSNDEEELNRPLAHAAAHVGMRLVWSDETLQLFVR
jgi:4-amino-4-deoxy-L-arabinose transferase-like glycosyltransferase